MKIENQDHHEKFLQQFLLVNTSKSYLKEVLDLHNDIENMSAGKIRAQTTRPLVEHCKYRQTYR